MYNKLQQYNGNLLFYKLVTLLCIFITKLMQLQYYLLPSCIHNVIKQFPSVILLISKHRHLLCISHHGPRKPVSQIQCNDKKADCCWEQGFISLVQSILLQIGDLCTKARKYNEYKTFNLDMKVIHDTNCFDHVTKQVL